MLIAVIIFLPIVLAYTSCVYRVMRGPVTSAEENSEKALKEATHGWGAQNRASRLQDETRALDINGRTWTSTFERDNRDSTVYALPFCHLT
jgi:hypothetical protein